MTPLVLYHRTSIGHGSEAVRNGFRDEEWTFGIRGSRARDEDNTVGVWVTDRPLNAVEGPPGDAVLEVTLDLSEDAIQAFELDGIFHDARLWVIPAELLNQLAEVRIKEVDPNTSWSYEAGLGGLGDRE